MYIDYSKIEARGDRAPMMRLRTMSGVELGPLAFAFGVKFAINYSELSTVEFSVPRFVDGSINPLYSAVTGYKEVYTDDLGIYILTSPSTENDGVSDIKTVKGYSREYTFAKKQLFLEEGTYNFWNPAAPKDTILSRIIELDPTWSVGYVAPRLIGCYRTFDKYDSWALDFLYGDAMEKYRCAVVFDVYKKTVNVYDADEDAGALPIFLNYKNLVESTETEELTDELVTKLHVYGADDLSIREVNPTGADYLVDLSFFLDNGDLDVTVDGARLSDRVREWQREIETRQPWYTGLVSSRASLTARVLSEQAQLTELRGELDTLTIQQSAIIQAQSMETTSEGKQKWQGELDGINARIRGKEREISEQEELIEGLQREIDGYAESIAQVVGELSYEGYFSEAEREKLGNFLIEDELTEDTFVASDVDTGASGELSELSGGVFVTGSDIVRVRVPETGRTMYTFTGGELEAAGADLTARIVRGTLDEAADGQYVMTAYLGDTVRGGMSRPGGLITLNGELTQLSSNTVQEDPEAGELARGSALSFVTQGAAVFFTVNVSEFQRYSVEMELYDYAKQALHSGATATYEFNVDTANFIYQREFKPFKDKLELGKSVFLDLGSQGIIKPKLIGVELDFDDIAGLRLTFSNRYKLCNGAEKLAEEIRTSSRSGRSFDASKYIYNRWADRSSAVTDFMNGNLDAAKNTILGAANQSVWIDGAGLHIGRGQRQMRIVDNMIAMTDDGWQTAKMAMGQFATRDTGEVWGVNAELVAGVLLVGNNLVLQNPTDDGVMQFKVDATGAWLYNSRFVLQSENGLIVVDPKHGIAAGTKLLLDANGTTVTPEFLNEAGDIEFDRDGLPKNANFYLDVRDGSAYFRGTVYATDGVFNGTVYAKDGEFTGTVNANAGTFKGTVQASRYLDTSGHDMMNDGKFKSDYLEVDRLNVANNFIVDENGNVTMSGDITLSGGNITWGGNAPVQYRFSTSASGPWHSTMEAGDRYRQDSLDGGKSWGAAYQFRGTDGANGRNGSDASVTYDNIKAALQRAEATESSFITADEAGAPKIYGGEIYGGKVIGGLMLGGAFGSLDFEGIYNPDTKKYTSIFNGSLLEMYESEPWGGGLVVRTSKWDSSPFFAIQGGDFFYGHMYFKGVEFLRFGLSKTPNLGSPIQPVGEWDFSEASVTGLYLRFS